MAKMRSMSTGIRRWLSPILVSMCVALAFGVFPSAVNATTVTQMIIFTQPGITNIETTFTEQADKAWCDGHPEYLEQVRITQGPLLMNTNLLATNAGAGPANYTVTKLSHMALKLEIPTSGIAPLVPPVLPNETGQSTGKPGPSPGGDWQWLNIPAGGSLNAPNAWQTNAAAQPAIIINKGDPEFAFFVGAVPGEQFNVEFTVQAELAQIASGTWSGGNDTNATATLIIEYVCKEPAPGLQCSKSFDQAIVVPGDIITATATITNTGNTPITADVTDTLQAGLSYVAMVSGLAPDSVVGQVITWLGASLGPIPVGDTLTFVYTVSVDAIDPGQTLCNDFYGKSTDYPGIDTDHCDACVSREIPPPSVPTFTQWGIIGFALLLSVGGLWLIRRRESIS